MSEFSLGRSTLVRSNVSWSMSQLWVVCVCRDTNKDWQQPSSDKGAGPSDPGDLEVSPS